MSSLSTATTPASDDLLFDAERNRILEMDGVKTRSMDECNKEQVHVPDIINHFGREKAWAHTLVDSPSTTSTLIGQMPGEGNRMHFHPMDPPQRPQWS